MSKDGSLEDLFRKREEERNKTLLTLASESLSNFRSELTNLLETENSTIRSVIHQESEIYRENLRSLTKLRWKNPLLSTASITLGIFLGSFAPISYLSHQVTSQLETIKTQQAAIASHDLRLQQQTAAIEVNKRTLLQQVSDIDSQDRKLTALNTEIESLTNIAEHLKNGHFSRPPETPTSSASDEDDQ